MKVLLVILIVFGLLAFNTWMVMLLAGALGHIFSVPVLFLGFWQAMVVAMALGAVGSFFKSAGSS